MLLELKKITKSFEQAGKESNKEVLKNINLSVSENDAIAITGPSGSGKSTLLNLIGSLDLPSSGSISFKGQELTSYSEKQLAAYRNENIGFVFQMHHLLPQLTALENILLPILANGKTNQENQNFAMHLMENLQIVDLASQQPGYLSGGECQRVAVARALINKPSLILADEPTGSLDQNNAKQLGDLLLKIREEYKLAVLVVTHSMDLAARMQTKYELQDGTLV